MRSIFLLCDFLRGLIGSFCSFFGLLFGFFFAVVLWCLCLVVVFCCGLICAFWVVWCGSFRVPVLFFLVFGGAFWLVWFFGVALCMRCGLFVDCFMLLLVVWFVFWFAFVFDRLPGA